MLAAHNKQDFIWQVAAGMIPRAIGTKLNKIPKHRISLNFTAAVCVYLKTDSWLNFECWNIFFILYPQMF